MLRNDVTYFCIIFTTFNAVYLHLQLISVIWSPYASKCNLCTFAIWKRKKYPNINVNTLVASLCQEKLKFETVIFSQNFKWLSQEPLHQYWVCLYSNLCIFMLNSNMAIKKLNFDFFFEKVGKFRPVVCTWHSCIEGQTPLEFWLDSFSITFPPTIFFIFDSIQLNPINKQIKVHCRIFCVHVWCNHRKTTCIFQLYLDLLNLYMVEPGLEKRIFAFIFSN